jgi:hypothetical protein
MSANQVRIFTHFIQEDDEANHVVLHEFSS